MYKGAIPSLNLPASVNCNETVLDLDKQDKTSIWRPNVLSPLLKKMLNNTKRNKQEIFNVLKNIYYYQINKTIFFSVDGRPFSQQPKVLSPKVNKMLSNIIENFGEYLKIKFTR